ncbi:MAG: 50S ribosome-binding GTPase [Candidatus Marinimicrobia bacterium]|nr:50S ribosome-binding GTPase [Candidatus Neomarinimicrobiota bacterium]
MDHSALKETLEELLKQFDRLPDPPRETLRNEFQKLWELIVDVSNPCIIITGRRGAGKSSLINAIFKSKVSATGPVLSKTGEPVWHNFKNKKGTMEILDTRGLGDRTVPDSAEFKDAIDEIKNAIKKKKPHAMLFLCKAQDVDSHIMADMIYLNEIQEYINKTYAYNIPLIGLVTKVDELEPIDENVPPYDDEEKQENINTAVKALADSFIESEVECMRVIPVSAYTRFNEQDELSSSRIWNIDLLTDYLIDVLPESAQLRFARLSAIEGLQMKLANKIVFSTATLCAGIAATPIPVADILPITSAQVGMIISIAYLAGRQLDRENAKTFLTAIGINVGAGYLVRESVRAIVKFVFPGAGNAVSAAMAFAGTAGIGKAAAAYFIEGKNEEEAKEIFNKGYKNAKKEYNQDS